MTTPIKERPILFSGPMVRAILDGRKTQTRRIVKIPPVMVDPDPMQTTVGWLDQHECGPGWYCWMSDYSEEGAIVLPCPYGAVGDRLWVRETWNAMDFTRGSGKMWNEMSKEERLSARWYPVYKVDEDPEESGNYGGPYVPSIFMPRWASRILLEIESVRVERLQEIRTADIIAEGVQPDERYLGGANRYRHAWIDLWDKINAGRGAGWDTNPYVWVVSFKVVSQ